MGKLRQDVAPDRAIFAPSIVEHSDCARLHFINIIADSTGIHGVNRAVKYRVCTTSQSEFVIARFDAATHSLNSKLVHRIGQSGTVEPLCAVQILIGHGFTSSIFS